LDPYSLVLMAIFVMAGSFVSLVFPLYRTGRR
jgi:hypothetical protein